MVRDAQNTSDLGMGGGYRGIPKTLKSYCKGIPKRLVFWVWGYPKHGDTQNAVTLGPGTWDLGPGTWDLGPGTLDLGLGTKKFRLQLQGGA